MKPFSKAMMLTSIVAASLFAGCKKDTPEPTPITPVTPTPTIASLAAFFSAQGAQSQFFTINATATQTITGSQGTIVGFNANTFVTMSGAPVTGSITIELKEIYSKKDMLLSNMSTNAELYPGGPKEPLISGGEFYVHATQGSAPLKLGPGQTFNVFLPATNPNPQMSLFDGAIGANGVLWTPIVDSFASITLPSPPAPQGYFATCDSLGWGNADVFMSNPSYTSITMNITGTYDPAQISAFVWYDTPRVVWTCWGAFNSTNNTIVDSHTATGQAAHLVVISVKDGVLYRAIVATTITANGVYNLNMTQTTEAAFSAELAGLP